MLGWRQGRIETVHGCVRALAAVSKLTDSAPAQRLLRRSQSCKTEISPPPWQSQVGDSETHQALAKRTRNSRAGAARPFVSEVPPSTGLLVPSELVVEVDETPPESLLGLLVVELPVLPPPPPDVGVVVVTVWSLLKQEAGAVGTAFGLVSSGSTPWTCFLMVVI